MERSSPLTVQGWRSCQIILNKKTGLCLCNRVECPIYRKAKCYDCGYKIIVANSKDSKILKICLSAAGLFRREYVKDRNGIFQNIRSLLSDKDMQKDIESRIDFGTRLLIYKILLQLYKKYTQARQHVDTSDNYWNFVGSIKKLAELFIASDLRNSKF